tara:strand:+ start:1050 stop:1463 length:414 start_codon:yes stop_codon:yes gene_type:complete
MNFDYLKSSHNKVFKRNSFIYKFFKSAAKYKREKNFYLATKDKFNFIPKLYYFSDKRKLLIIENVGERIKKKEFIEKQNYLKSLHDEIVKKSGYYHRDLYYKNICKNSENKYFIIDFESSSKENINIHKKSKEFYIS